MLSGRLFVPSLTTLFQVTSGGVHAMQLYRGMDIGTAKLPVADRRGIPHHQLDLLEVTETASVARYQQAAAADIEAIAARGAVPVVVGGSMMYIQSLLDEWSFPATDPAVRAKWEQRLSEVGVGALHNELALVDAAAASTEPAKQEKTSHAKMFKIPPHLFLRI